MNKPTANASDLIDQRIEELSDWRGQVFAQLRKLILETDPEMVEEWKWNTAVWSHQGLVCSVSAFKKDVGLVFFQGVFLKDPNGLFNSGLDAKKMRTIKFREGDVIDESSLQDLIREAVAYNIAANQ